MNRRLRRWIIVTLLAGLVLVVLVGTAAIVGLPALARHLAVWRLEALTQRRVTIEALDLSLTTGEFSIRGFRIDDRDGGVLARFDTLEGRFHRRSFAQGHLWIEDAVLTNGHVRIVRVGPNRFNISDLLERPREPTRGFPMTIDHLAIRGGSVELEDRVLKPPRTWRSQDIQLEARDVGTSGRHGVAVGSTTLAGALITVRVSDLQLFPVHLRAEVNVRDVDLALAALYLPATGGVRLEQGLVHAGVTIVHDATDGTAVDVEAVVEHLALSRAGESAAVTSPQVQILVRELHQQAGRIALRHASLGADTVTVLDPTTSPPTPLVFRDVTATAGGLEQPMKGPARVAVHASLPGGGEIDASGTAGVDPRRVDLRVRARAVPLASLNRYLDLRASLAGIATADVRVVAAHDGAVTATVTGDVAVQNAAVGDGPWTPLSAVRVDARGLTYTYPATVRVADLTLTQPPATVERAADGPLDVQALARPRAAPEDAATRGAAARPAPLDVTVTRLTIAAGRASFTDAARAQRVTATAIDAVAEDVTWPSKGPARVRLSTDVVGGRVSVRGTVEAGSRPSNLAVSARRIDLAALQPWLPPVAGKVRGAADADVTLAVVQEPFSVEVRGTIASPEITWTDGVRPAVTLTRIDVAGENVTWPARGPAPVRLEAHVAGGRVRASGTVNPTTRRAELAVQTTGLDLAAAQPWLPIVGRVRGAADVDVKVALGLQPLSVEARGSVGVGDLALLDGSRPLLTVKRVDAAGVDLAWPTRLAIDRLRVNTPWAEVARTPQGELSLRALFRRRPDRPAPAAAGDSASAPAGPLPGMQLSVGEAIFENGSARIIDDAVEPAARFDLAGSRLELRNLTWPARGIAAIQMSTPMPGGGTLKAAGTLSIEPTRLALDAELDQVDMAPARPYLPFDARIAGKLSGRATVKGTFGDTIRLVIEGDAGVDRPRLGDLERRLATADRIELAGFRYSYPTSIRIRELTARKPWLLVERNSDGSLELVQLFARKATAAEPVAAPAATPPPASPPPGGGRRSRRDRVRVLVEKLVVEDGFIRYVDRTTDPDYAEELSQVRLLGENLGTTPTREGAAPRRGTIDLQGRFPTGTPLAVKGTIGSYPGPLYADVTVEVARFPVPRLNPYLDRLSSWIARQGTLTAALGYKVDGDELDAVNQVVIDGLELEPGGRGNEFSRRTGLPLSTLVSVLKDRQGVIRLTVPVHGRLSSPDFEYSEAMWAAVRNLAIRLVALPFSLVGKLVFTEDSRIEAIQIDPVTFLTASATPDPAGARHLANLARFLQEKPEIRLRLRPVTTVADVTALRRQALDSRLALPGADQAARRQAAVGLYTELFPRRTPPTSDEALYDELARETPTPPRALRTLTAERVAAVHDALVRAGVAPDRLQRLESRAGVESEGTPRVEFEIGR